ncbi:putative ubiquitin-conjugating enzyme e2 [Leptomonas pyrrhocoris]|uniref:Putative ubiquitin-conjugating enzyme e2 n=1 Tax=Leptomonas pyrrhocoris TaxID=157538 RepID=A0A0M9G4S9_LEPPY|nr:putative ubiquitin-conjugating enzyme e2 [Leptomonas pyrrhocoris]KPA82119.1 putative ubiquitin-conjugating enzyme e2 [Leptomonas pyrrhocoris]|eukprot:XP_015660558.1 putative ubiquitin-conjugating enzyme e2 [Leptomonas pyrrhocoris]
MSSPTAQCIKRLQTELRKLAMEKDLPFKVGADPQNMLRCYFVVDGPEGTPYAGGRYVGLLGIPPDYPFKPPSVQMCTPSGRFKTGMPICLSNSSYHPEQWSPLWGLRTILIALVSFFASEEATTGSTESSQEDRRKYAASSRQFNVERIKAVYQRVLPEAYAKDVTYLEEQRQQEHQGLAGGHTPRSDSTSGSSDSEEGDDVGRGRGPAAQRGPQRSTPLVTAEVGTAGQEQGNGNSNKEGSEDAGKPEEDSTTANGEAKEVAAAEEKPLNAEPLKRHHRHHARHRTFAGEERGGTVMGLGGVPWRRWVSLAVLVAVGLVLVEQLRWGFVRM